MGEGVRGENSFNADIQSFPQISPQLTIGSASLQRAWYLSCSEVISLVLFVSSPSVNCSGEFSFIDSK